MSSLKKFILWLLTLTLLIIIGVSDVFALETKTIYSINNNGTLSSANTYNYGYLTGGGTQGISRASVGNVINGVSYGFNFSFYENVVLNKSYTLVINFMDVDLLKSFNSSMVQVSTCNGDTCNNNTIISVLKSSNTNNSNKLTIEFNPITTGNIIYVNLGSSNPITGVSTFGIRSVTLDSSNQNEDIMNNANQNANNIINNQNSNTEDIINSQESSASSIIDNQNSSASAIIENQNQNNQNLIESNKVCSLIDKLNIVTDNKYLSSDGTLTSSSNWGVTGYINIYRSDLKVLSQYSSNNVYICYYDVNKNLINCQSLSTLNNLVIPDNTYYFRGSIQKSQNRPTYQVCKNGSQANSDKLDEQTNAINGLKDVLTDTDVDTSSLVDVSGWLPAGPVDSILNLPLTLLDSLSSSLSSSCSALTVPLPYVDKNLSIPCLSTIFNKITGLNSFWTWVGGIASAFILYNYLLNLYAWVDGVLMLRLNMYEDFGGDPANFG